MKLVEILARDLQEWPKGRVVLIAQAVDGDLIASKDSNFSNTFYLGIHELSEDHGTASVTRAQWETERARILLESQPERDADVAKVVDGVAARSAEDQALWDKVAIACYAQNVQVNREREGAAICAFDDADAFMAERAKRMKG